MPYKNKSSAQKKAAKKKFKITKLPDGSGFAKISSNKGTEFIESIFNPNPVVHTK